MAIVAANLGVKYGTMYSTEVFHYLWLITAIFSAIFTAIAVFSIAPKDRTEFFGTGKAVRIRIADYWDCLKNNRAIQMLVVSASTDKLASSAKTSTVTLVLFAIVVGNYTLSGTMSGFTSIPGLILLIFLVGGLATTLGQRKGMLIGSWGGIVICLGQILLWLCGDPTTMSNADGSLHWGYFSILYVVLTVAFTGFNGLSGNIVIPMTADCADYEVYRTGRYVPGMMGTLFSFVDKIISSLAPMIAGLMFAAIGFKDALPDVNTPYTPELKYVAVFLSYGLVIIGLICNVIALHFYPLTKEKMAEIQGEIAAIKAKAAKEA
jgi:Na+/melibiose symporter-like transporter